MTIIRWDEIGCHSLGGDFYFKDRILLYRWNKIHSFIVCSGQMVFHLVLVTTSTKYKALQQMSGLLFCFLLFCIPGRYKVHISLNSTHSSFVKLALTSDIRHFLKYCLTWWINSSTVNMWTIWYNVQTYTLHAQECIYVFHLVFVIKSKGFPANINTLKTSTDFMYNRFKMCTFVLCVDLRTKTCYFPIQY
jgi:hypothetical protein